jgi:hypothetical protein
MHCSHFETEAAFYRACGASPNKTRITSEDIEKTVLDLKGKALVRFRKNDGVTVVSLSDGPERYPAQSKYKCKTIYHGRVCGCAIGLETKPIDDKFGYFRKYPPIGIC